MGINPIRSAVAVVGGPLLLIFVASTLATVLLGVLSQGNVTDESAMLALQNRPVVLIMNVVTHALASTLAGYILAKVAGLYEVRHAMVAAGLLTVVHLFALSYDDPRLPPMWVRIVMLLITPPAMIAGAHIRAEARVIQAEQAGPGRPDEGRQ